MNFENIENFEGFKTAVLTAQHGSLTAAAKLLQITPAAASAALKKLEAQLGVRLFERSTRSMRITQQGQVLVDYATRALQLLEEGTAQITEDQRSLRGTLRMTAPSDLTRRMLLPWLDEFLALHPNVSLNLSVSDTLHDVVRDEVDVAIRYGALADSRLAARLLAPARRIACAAPAYLRAHGTPAHPRELTQHQCLTFTVRNRRYVTWRFFENGSPIEVPGSKAGRRSIDVRVDGRRTVDDADIAHHWALQGHGIIYKSELDLQDSLANGQLVQLFEGFEGEEIPLNAVMPSNRFVPARVRGVVEFLRGRFAAK
jgi:DNA-binding transcriptional LysR family regulator